MNDYTYYPDILHSFKLDLGKAEEPEIKLTTSVGSLKKQESSRKISASALLTTVQSLWLVIITNHGKLFKRWEYQATLTCLLRNLYAGQETTVRTGHGAMDWLKIGKGVRQGCVLSPCLFNLYAEYIMRNTGLDEAQAGIKISRRNSNLRYVDDTTHGRKQIRTRVSWWKWKRRVKKLA